MAQPLYLQIMDDLRRRIELGADLAPDTPRPAELGTESSAADDPANPLPAVLRPGARLPTELELCVAYQASRNTIREAVRRLTSQGLVATRQGQGTFVTRKIDPFVTYLSPRPAPDPATSGADPAVAAYLSEVGERPRQATHSAPDVRVVVPEPEVMNRLRLEAGSQVICRHQRRYIDGVPWSLQSTFYPREFVARGAEDLLMAKDIAGGAVRYLADTLGVQQAGLRDWITARNPDKNEQEFFEIAPDANVFVIFRTGFDQDMKPMRVTVNIFPVDRNQFIVDYGEVPDPQYGPDSDD
jgi:GntR family transcriptional regulator